MIELDECWLYYGDCLTEPPEGYYGYVYCIIDDTGKSYWGKKAFVHSTRKVISKRARAISGSKKRIERGVKDSKWLEYWGSCKPLLQYIQERGGTHGFKRYILKLCKDKSSLAYWEMAYMVENKVLFREDCWNGNIISKFFKSKIHE